MDSWCAVVFIINHILIEAQWRIYASVNNTTIGPDNGLSPVRCQSIIWANASFFVNCTHGNTYHLSFNQHKNIFIEENAFENMICEMWPFVSVSMC